MDETETNWAGRSFDRGLYVGLPYPIILLIGSETHSYDRPLRKLRKLKMNIDFKVLN